MKGMFRICNVRRRLFQKVQIEGHKLQLGEKACCQWKIRFAEIVAKRDKRFHVLTVTANTQVSVEKFTIFLGFPIVLLVIRKTGSQPPDARFPSCESLLPVTV